MRVIDEDLNLDSTIRTCESARKSHSQPRNVRQMKLCGLGYPVQYKM